MFRPLVALLLLTFACGSEEPSHERSHEPTNEPRATLAPDERPRLIDALTRPPPLEPEDVTRLIAEVERRVDLSAIPEAPTIGASGAVVAEASERPLIGRVPPDPAILVDTPAPLVARQPWAVLEADGVAFIHVETTREVPGGAVSFGAVQPDAPIAPPRHRHRTVGLVRRASEPSVHAYAARIDLRSLLAPIIDVTGIGRTGRGTVAWHLELIDLEDASTQVFDGELPFRLRREGDAIRWEALPSLVQGPFVDLVHAHGATLSFETDAATTALIALFPEGRAPELLEVGEPGTHHAFGLDNLDPGTRYRYQPVVVDRTGRVHVHRGGTFETHAESLARLSFVMLGDSRSGHGSGDVRYGGTNARVMRTLLEEVMRGDPRFVVFVGDLIDGYTTRPGVFQLELDQFRRALQPFAAHLPIYEAMGNHEALLDIWSDRTAAYRMEPSAEALFGAAFVNPTNAPTPRPPEGDVLWPPYEGNVYSFDVGEVHVAVVNSNYAVGLGAGPFRRGQREGTIDDVQLAWLDADLAAARERGMKHLLVAAHEPAFPNGGHAKDTMWWNGQIPEMREMRRRFMNVLGAHRVLALVCADEHNYSRLRIDDSLIEGLASPVWHLTSGGAGAPYYAQETDVPWADRVAKFDPRQHFLRFDVDGARVDLTVIGLNGEQIESLTLTAP